MRRVTASKNSHQIHPTPHSSTKFSLFRSKFQSIPFANHHQLYSKSEENRRIPIFFCGGESRRGVPSVGISRYVLLKDLLLLRVYRAGGDCGWFHPRIWCVLARIQQTEVLLPPLRVLRLRRKRNRHDLLRPAIFAQSSAVLMIGLNRMGYCICSISG